MYVTFISTKLQFCHLNAQSVRNKTVTIVDYICERNIDVCAITESWLKEGDIVKENELSPDGYKLKSTPRSGRGGGGIALIYRESLKPEHLSSFEKDSFECTECSFTIDNSRLNFIVVYRPTYSEAHPVTKATFLREFSEYLETALLLPGSLLITGDFNLHVDNSEDSDAANFLQILDSCGLKQHIHEPTHREGHTLDLIITREDENVLYSAPIVDFMISDHLSVLAKLHVPKPPLAVKQVTFRKLKTIDVDAFSRDLANSNLVVSPPEDLDSLVSEYNRTLQTLLDKHAPEKTRHMVIRHRDPWFNDHIKQEKVKRKKLEKSWRTSKTMAAREQFKLQRNHVTLLMERAKTEFYSSKVNEISGDQKALFKLIRKLCGHKTDTPWPVHETASSLAEEFSNFFFHKIEDIRVKLDSNVNIRHEMATDSLNVDIEPLSEFDSLSDRDVRDLFMKAATKTCALDPLPTSLLKECIDTLLPVLTLLVNLSLSCASFPDEWKLAIILPLLKKLGLDLVLKSYRPVSNLQFVSKVTEKAAELQISGHVTKNKLHYPMQSSYRQGHSTETALLRVQNDVYCAMDREEVVLLLLLDLSAAFDTLDADILLSRLENRFRITGNVLCWIRSYLTDRKQSVCIKNETSSATSDPKQLKWGVPQGSVLGPVLFTAYTAPLGDLAQEHGVNMHCYADDSQPYLSFRPAVPMAEEMAVDKLNGFVQDIRAWMLANKLKLNDD